MPTFYKRPKANETSNKPSTHTCVCKDCGKKMEESAPSRGTVNVRRV